MHRGHDSHNRQHQGGARSRPNSERGIRLCDPARNPL